MKKGPLTYENRRDEFSCRKNEGDGDVLLDCRPHLHRHIELVCMLEGETVGRIDSRDYTIRAGDIFIAFPNQVHSFTSSGREGYLLFILSPDLLPEYGDQLTMTVPESPLLRSALVDHPQLLTLFSSLARISARGKEYAYRDVVRRGYLLAAFGELFHLLALQPPRGADATVMKGIINYCARNYTSDLSLSVLESELHVSKYYISHLFSSRLGIRFNDYINSFRVSAACRYLGESDKSMTEISRIVGFNTLRTFNRAFVKQIGVTPSEYKKRLEGGNSPVSIPL